MFLAGLGLFESETYWPVHGGFGYGIVHPVALVLIIFAAISKLPLRVPLLAITAGLLSFFMPVFVGLPPEFSFYGALHPTSAIITFAMAVVLAVGAREFVPPPWGRAKSEEPPL